MVQPCSGNQKRRENSEWLRVGKKRSKINMETNMETPTVIPPSIQNANRPPRVTFVLDKASLKLGIIRKASKILNVEEHSQFLLKQKKNLDDYRPDILHRSLLAIIDSPVWKRGMVQAIYVKIDNGVLFEVKPDTRIPRMHKRFYGLMVDLLKKSCITASDKHEKLLRVVQQPVTQHLPSNSRIIGLSHSSEKLVKLKDYVASINDDVNLVFVVGLMMQGEIDKTYIDDFISVSRRQLSSSGTIGGFICDSLEEMWNII